MCNNYVTNCQYINYNKSPLRILLVPLCQWKLTQNGPQRHKWGLLKPPLQSFSRSEQVSLDHHRGDGYVQVSLECNGPDYYRKDPVGVGSNSLEFGSIGGATFNSTYSEESKNFYPRKDSINLICFSNIEIFLLTNMI